MKKRVPDKFWFPWWPDKWIFGSVRIEFTVAERGIWVDMLSLASKDDGHIRANEETPYPLAQLAGMLIIPEKELDAAINKFIKKGKVTKLKSGTLYVTKWEKYQLSRTTRFYAEKGRDEQNGSHSEKKRKPYYIKLNNKHNKVNNKKHIAQKQKTINAQFEKEFSQFYDFYDKKVAKHDTLKAFKALRRKGETFENIMAAVKGYDNHLKHEKVHNNFEQTKMYPATFLRNEKWKDFVGVEYTPPL